MATWRCKDCQTAYAVDAPSCPQCGSRKHVEVGAKGDPGPASEPTPGAEPVDPVAEGETDAEDH